MVSLTERWIGYFLCSYYLKGRSSVHLPLEEALNDISDLAGTNDACIQFPLDAVEFTRKIVLQDIQIDPGYSAVILFVCIDTSVSSVFGHAETFKLREPEREDGEYGGSYAHLVIDLSSADSGVYPCVLEESAGLSMSSISHLLNLIFRKNVFYTLSSTGSKEHSPTFKIEKRADAILARELAQGELLAVEFSRDPSTKELGPDPRYSPKQYSMKFSIPVGLSGKGAMAAIKTMLGFETTKDFEKLHIAFRDADGRHRSAVEDLKPGQEELSKLIHRKLKLNNFITPLPVDPPRIVSEIASEMIKALKD